ncbi:aldehyde ferredoxin oxidoreductase family protein [Candidatus Aerophobetes bacterium]|nr:aldehyde ferredoxin oxidoreductase family protein [Candidatus Aerophobetes bacterium]
MKCGYTGRIIWVDLTKRKIEIQEIGDEARDYIGGSGLAAKILYEEVPPNIDPLGPDNLLIFMTGPLTGTPVPCGRHSIVAKSPLTGIWGEASVGGTWGRELKKAGYDGVIIKGQSEKPVYLWISDDKIEIREATHLWGKDTYEVDEIIKKETDRNAVVSSIGQAGEKLVKISSIHTNGKHSRAAARCGLGAVAGAKNLKAIVVKGSKRPKIFCEDKLMESVRRVIPSLKEKTEVLRNFGTANLVIPCEIIGDLPIKNWREGEWEEGAKKISGERMSETVLVGRFHCAGCPIGCGREIRIAQGPFAGVEGAGPEYETIGTIGSSCLIDNLEAIAKANELCNRYGMDTIEVGGAVAFAMECYENGLISRRDTGGVSLLWGDSGSLIRIIEMIGKAEGFGEILAQGLPKAAQQIGGLAFEFAIHTKGLAFPAHDPRAFNSLALGYATSNRGACHLQAFSHPFERSLTLPELGYIEPQDRFSNQGKGKFVAKLQDLMSLFDALCICKFVIFGGIKIAQLVEWLNLTTGWDMTLEEFMKIGERIFNLKRLYNVKCGISRKDDTLPPRILTHRRKKGGAANNLPHLGKMLSEYYEYRGWNEEGIPTQRKIQELGIR